MKEDMEALVIELPSHIIQVDQEFQNINDPELIKEVKEECRLIKEYFSKEEIGRLKLAYLDGEDVHKCVYGQMIGNCNSPKVANFIVNNLNVVYTSLIYDNIQTIKLDHRSSYWLTPLEYYITPTEQESEWFDEETDLYPDSYYERLRNVYNWIKNSKE